MMSYIDVAIIAIVLLSSIIGIVRGFVREVLSLVSWVAAFYIAGYFHKDLLPHLSFISPEVFRVIAAFLLVFLIVIICFSLFNFLIARFIDKTGITGTDRTLGFVFGAARGSAIIMVLVSIFGLTSASGTNAWMSSFLIPHVNQLTQKLEKHLPDQISNFLQSPALDASDLDTTEPSEQENVFQSEEAEDFQSEVTDDFQPEVIDDYQSEAIIIEGE